MYIDLKIGAKKDGTLTGKEVKIIGAAGGRAVYSMVIVATACYRPDSLYHFRNLRTEGLTAYTNTVPTSCFRGFGNAQMTFAIESCLDMIAEAIGMDPAELRIKNGLKTGKSPFTVGRLAPAAWRSASAKPPRLPAGRRSELRSGSPGGSGWLAAITCRGTAPLQGNSTAEPESCASGGKERCWFITASRTWARASEPSLPRLWPKSSAFP